MVSIFWDFKCITIFISAINKTANGALVTLLGIWLMLVIVLPKSLQAVGYYFYPTPSKIEMETAVEADLKKIGEQP